MTYTPNLWGHSIRGVFPRCLAYLLEEGHPSSYSSSSSLSLLPVKALCRRLDTHHL